MALLEISPTQTRRILFDYINEDCNNVTFQSLVMSILREAKLWEDFDWQSVKVLVDKQAEKRTDVRVIGTISEEHF